MIFILLDTPQEGFLLGVFWRGVLYNIMPITPEHSVGLPTPSLPIRKDRHVESLLCLVHDRTQTFEKLSLRALRIKHLLDGFFPLNLGKMDLKTFLCLRISLHHRDI